MRSESLVDRQVKVKITWLNGVGTVILPNGESFTWPIKDELKTNTEEEVYLVTSPSSVLPSQKELAKLVLKEILKSQYNKEV
ncbi:MAG: hypothetical protein U9M89_03055 [Patescibacteria group bacterium]|nr:hypothetical protein [Patescibacteria group bacterium]